MQLFLDITRIAYRLTGTTPTGIDRVEHAYATRVLRGGDFPDALYVFTAPFFTGALHRDKISDLLDRLATAWRLDASATEDTVWLELRGYLQTPIGHAPLKRRFRNVARLRHLRKNMIYPLRDMARAPTRLRRWLKRGGDTQRIYLNTSHNQLETPERLAWTGKSAIRNVFFIHDTIPIDYPEFVGSGTEARHARRLVTTASMADLVIVNSATTRRQVENYLDSARLRVPPMVVVPLGVADAFLRVAAASRINPQPHRGHPYFVTLSTIEPRKNLLFLFTVWRRLIERLGTSAPRLVVAGARGWENENIADVLERSRELGPYLVEVSDLCDEALAHLLDGATALLQPSTVEGFGLPLIEGLTLGTPVIASDIAAHREVAGDFADLVDTIDGGRWLQVIEQFADRSSGWADRRRTEIAAYAPMSWSGHVDAALAAIGNLR